MLRRVARTSWSIRCHAAAALLYGVILGGLMFWPALIERIPLGWFAFGAVWLNVAGVTLKYFDKDLRDED